MDVVYIILLLIFISAKITKKGVNFCYHLTPKGPKAIFKPFLKFGQAIVKAIFIKNS
jgi:hypothetical protein